MVAQLPLWLDGRNKTPQLRITIQQPQRGQLRAVAQVDVTQELPLVAIGILQVVQQDTIANIVADQSHTIAVRVYILGLVHAVDTVWFTQVLVVDHLTHQVIQFAVMAWPQVADQLDHGFGAMAAVDKMLPVLMTPQVTLTVPKWLVVAALAQFVSNP